VLRRSVDKWSLNALVTGAKGSQEEGKWRAGPLRKSRRQTWWCRSESEVTHGAAACIRS
jgi:hypothetical protein